MEVKVKKLSDKAVIPTYATDGSAGLDITTTGVKPVIQGGSAYLEYKTDLALEIPEGYVGLLFPRSSISKTNLVLANSVGMIDSDYRGEITFRFKNAGSGKAYEVGDRIGQLLIVPYPKIQLTEVNELNDTKRGKDGWGSTGK